MNKFPFDLESNLTGFGGDRSMTQAQHRAALKKTPVVLVHGNAGHSAHPKWGMEIMKGFLKREGYEDCEIWAMDHLGENNDQLDLIDPHRNHIDSFRLFVDRVREYLGVKKLDFIAHSLGCGMVNAYLRGLQKDGQWDNSQHRLDVASTFVSLAGATYGLGKGSGEFNAGSDFERRSHQFKKNSQVVIDDTPQGSNKAAAQEAPASSWIRVTELDSDEIRYVAIIAEGDFVDVQNRDTGRREGAHLNNRVPLGSGADGHEKIIKSQTVFNMFKGLLNQHPPVPSAKITVDKESGSYAPGLQITVAVVPSNVSVSYTAERVTQQFKVGFIIRSVSETRTGTLSDGQTLTLSTDGVWDVVFRAEGADEVRRTYGVNVAIPGVTILTESWPPSLNTLEVTASTTSGTLYHSTDREHWVEGSVALINRTATVSFIAIDTNGIASVVVSRPYTKPVPWTDTKTGTLTEHFIARRLSVNDYVSLGHELGFNSVLTLYLVEGKWVRNPEVPSVSRAQPEVSLLARRAILVADKLSGEYPGAFEVTIAAARQGGERLKIYYTEDGSDPSDANNTKRASFDTQRTFTIQDNGHHSILCYAQDSTGHRSFQSFAWSIDDQQYPGTAISPSLGGIYADRIEVKLHPSETCAWTKYTTDGSEPSDTVGTSYSESHPILIEKTTVLKFCSKDRAGNMEPVKTATFTIAPLANEVIFFNDGDKDGYVKANSNGGSPQVGTFENLAVGCGWDENDNRAILNFDTSALPDNATVTQASLQVELHSAGDLWAEGAPIQVDVKTGYFGSSRALQAHDWDAKATAEAVAQVERFASGVKRSTDFSQAGRNAINPNGITQIRLRADSRAASPGKYAFIKGGAAAKLFVQYAVSRS